MKRPSGDTRGQLPDVKGGPIVKCVTSELELDERAGVQAAIANEATAVRASAATHGHTNQWACDGMTAAPGAPFVCPIDACDPEAAIKACSNSPAVW